MACSVLYHIVRNDADKKIAKWTNELTVAIIYTYTSRQFNI